MIHYWERLNAPVVADIDGLREAHIRIVAQQSAGGSIRDERSSSSSFTLGGYAVAVATLPR
jgi:hypothetical protein